MLAAEQELAVAHTMTMPSQCSQLLLLPPILLLLPLATTAHTIILAADAAEQHPITLAGCPEKCGDISIPYPFGIKDGCFRDDRFQVICNHSFNPPRAFLPRDSAYHEISEENYSTNTTVSSSAPFSRPRDGFAPVELVDISASKSEVRVYGGISSDCIDPGTEFDHRVKEQGTQLGPFPFSEDGTRRNFGPENTTTFRLSLQHNVLIGVGRTVKATFSGSLSAKFDPGLLACFSFAMIDSHTNGLCQGEGCCQASFPPDANVTFLDDMFKDKVFPTDGFAVTLDLKQMSDLGTTCSYGMIVESSWYSFSSEDMFGHLVLANKHPRGVPVVLDFAIRNRSCPAEGQQLPQDYACISENSYCAKPPMGDGYVCRCWDNYDGNPYITNGCQGLAIFVVVTVLMVLAHQLLKLKKFYEQNGGPVLEGVKNIRIYTSKQLKRMTNNYKVVIGEGHFGKVYMGIQKDKQEVAIKKTIKVDEGSKKDFIDEVIIQSGMRHKNIVRLLGCCLEMDVPMLMYENVVKGSLYDVLFKSKDNVPVDTRLRIAIGSAEGLAYMHSAVESTIHHGDVKSGNILLDESFTPKISDFGTSKLLAKGKSVKTEWVTGDMAYIDPAYMVHGILTQKSDVYSFGIVLIELITRRVAKYDDNMSYAKNFVQACQDQRARNFVDNDITSEKDIEIMEMVSEVALECLKLNPDERLDMREVENRLYIIGQSEQHGQERA